MSKLTLILVACDYCRDTELDKEKKGNWNGWFSLKSEGAKNDLCSETCADKIVSEWVKQ